MTDERIRELYKLSAPVVYCGISISCFENVILREVLDALIAEKRKFDVDVGGDGWLNTDQE